MSIKWAERDGEHGQSVRRNLAVNAHLLYTLVNTLWQRTIHLNTSNIQHNFILSFTTRMSLYEKKVVIMCVNLRPESVTFINILKSKINLNYI
jgi:hypothetical protein